MGTLAHYNVPELAKRFALKSFVETGTAQGDSLAVACTAPFEVLHSIEIVPAIAAAARMRFASDARVQIWEDDSRHALPMILRELPRAPALFWLDAHFPGAHHGADYAAEPNTAKRLPLLDEIAVIATLRAGCRDVILIDDARIYQPGPYAAGDLPADWPPLAGVERSLRFVREAFGATHGVVIDHADQGYVMVVPHARLRAAA